MQNPPHHSPHRGWIWGVVLLCAAAGALAFDLPAARWAKATFAEPISNSWARETRRVLDLTEIFGHRYGLGLIAITVFMLAPGRRRRVPLLVASAYLGGYVCDTLKLVLARLRPYKAPLDGSVFETFVAWWPSLSNQFGEIPYGRDFQSLPSGHAGGACALAVALSHLYPQGRGWFAVLSALAMLQRVAASQHFPSDVLAGGGVGVLVAWLLSASSVAGRWFDTYEKK